jgi:hypothetical protein
MTQTSDNPLSADDNMPRPKRKRGNGTRNYKKHAKELIAAEFPEIMKAMAEKSKQGSLGHAKFLFEIGGLKEELERQGRGRAEPSLADLLMAEIKRQNAKSDAASEQSANGEAGDRLPTVAETDEEPADR